MERPKREDFGKICRLCLKGANLVNIFERNPKTGTESLSTLVRETVEMLGLAIDPTDPYPRKICLGCKDFLRNLHKFRQQAQEANDLVTEVVDTEPADQEMPEAHVAAAPALIPAAAPESQIPARSGTVVAVKNESKNVSQNPAPRKVGGLAAPIQPRYHCVSCGISFTSPKALSMHMKNNHAGRLKCRICGMQFMRESNYLMHECHPWGRLRGD